MEEEVYQVPNLVIEAIRAIKATKAEMLADAIANLEHNLRNHFR